MSLVAQRLLGGGSGCRRLGRPGPLGLPLDRRPGKAPGGVGTPSPLRPFNLVFPEPGPASSTIGGKRRGPSPALNRGPNTPRDGAGPAAQVHAMRAAQSPRAKFLGRVSRGGSPGPREPQPIAAHPVSHSLQPETAAGKRPVPAPTARPPLEFWEFPLSFFSSAGVLVYRPFLSGRVVAYRPGLWPAESVPSGDGEARRADGKILAGPRGFGLTVADWGLGSNLTCLLAIVPPRRL